MKHAKMSLLLVAPLLVWAPFAAADGLDPVESVALLATLWPELSAATRALLVSVLVALSLPQAVRLLQPLFPAKWTWDDWLLAHWGAAGTVLVKLWRAITAQYRLK